MLIINMLKFYIIEKVFQKINQKKTQIAINKQLGHKNGFSKTEKPFLEFLPKPVITGGCRLVRP